MRSSDFDLLAAWRAGDRGAGQELFERHYDGVYRFFDSKIGEDTEDLVGQTFRKCRADDGQAPKDLRVYLLRLARTNLYEFFEHHSELDPSRPPDPMSMTLEELGGKPATLVQDTPEPLLRALTQIPLESQLIMELQIMEDLDTTDLAYVFDANEEEADLRLRRASELLCMNLHLPVGTNVRAHFGLTRER